MKVPSEVTWLSAPVESPLSVRLPLESKVWLSANSGLLLEGLRELVVGVVGVADRAVGRGHLRHQARGVVGPGVRGQARGIRLRVAEAGEIPVVVVIVGGCRHLLGARQVGVLADRAPLAIFVVAEIDLLGGHRVASGLAPLR